MPGAFGPPVPAWSAPPAPPAGEAPPPYTANTEPVPPNSITGFSLRAAFQRLNLAPAPRSAPALALISRPGRLAGARVPRAAIMSDSSANLNWLRTATFLPRRNLIPGGHILTPARLAAEPELWRSIDLRARICPRRTYAAPSSAESKEEWHTRLHRDLLRLLHLFKRTATRPLAGYVKELSLDHRLSTKNCKLLVELVDQVKGISSLAIVPQEPYVPRSIKNQGHNVFFDFLLLSGNKFQELTTLLLAVDFGVLPEEIVAVVQGLPSLKTLTVRYVEHSHGRRLAALRQTTFVARAYVRLPNLTSASFSVVGEFPNAFLHVIANAPHLKSLMIEPVACPPSATYGLWSTNLSVDVVRVVAALPELKTLTWRLTTLDVFDMHIPQGGFKVLAKLVIADGPLPVCGWRPELTTFPALPALVELTIETTDTVGPSYKPKRLRAGNISTQYMSSALQAKLSRTPKLLRIAVRPPAGGYVKHARYPRLAAAQIVRDASGMLRQMKILTRAVPEVGGLSYASATQQIVQVLVRA